MSSDSKTAKTVVVTGATHGIGRALALEFHRLGHRVLATGRDREALNELAGMGLRATRLDVTDVAELAEFAIGLDAVDVLVNNAGYGLMGPAVELTLDDVRHQFEVNTIAPLAVTQALLPALLAAQDPRLVTISSVSGVLTTPFAGPYCASKAAVSALTDALRLELAPFGIRVLTIQPGHVASDFGATARKLVNRDWSSSRYASMQASIVGRAEASQHRATPAQQFARSAVAHTCSPSPRPVTTLGRGGRSLVLLGRCAPVTWRDRLLRRRFDLHTAR